ncbi:DUF2924 domain-containing protein [Ruficoccus amylovorans]|uniref:DUF2924 domain-containing protein n=1 Tax=Ruficoccus amylovorans TaxID=1804625 RepID=A0A842HJ85_9BACT|nr:DUF2924 domain-containing protein [Ruficoccus amylovorans]MBC2595646.1 DUF2924 domain-containing protein [Ruficoccus amylovorans]
MDTLQLTTEIRALRQMSVGELRARYAEVFGEKNRSRNKDYLVRRIAWRIQADTSGGISERARLRAQELANEADLRVCHTERKTLAQRPAQQTVTEALRAPYSPARDPRLPPPGTVLTREFKGQTISVLVEHDSFRWNGQQFKSLSAIAREVTGKSWNGFIFFKCAQQS